MEKNNSNKLSWVLRILQKLSDKILEAAISPKKRPTVTEPRDPECSKWKGVARAGKHRDCAHLSVLRRSGRTSKES